MSCSSATPNLRKNTVDTSISAAQTYEPIPIVFIISTGLCDSVCVCVCVCVYIRAIDCTIPKFVPTSLLSHETNHPKWIAGAFWWFSITWKGWRSNPVRNRQSHEKRWMSICLIELNRLNKELFRTRTGWFRPPSNNLQGGRVGQISWRPGRS